MCASKNGLNAAPCRVMHTLLNPVCKSPILQISTAWKSYDLVRLGLTKSESQALTSVVFLKSGPWLKKVISDSEPWLLVMTSHSHDFFRPKKSEPWLDIAWDFSWGFEPIWEIFDPFSADFRVFCVFSPLSVIDPLLYDAFWVSWLSHD